MAYPVYIYLADTNGHPLQLAGPSLTVGKGKNSKGQTRISYGFSLLKGSADHPIEDYHVAKFICMRDQELGLFAVFDGHLGDSVPAYLQKHLFANILEEVISIFLVLNC